MRSMPRFFVVMITLCCCVGCDQVSKSAARTLLASGVTESLFADSLRLQLVQNPGAFLSLGGSLPEQLRFTLFTAAAAVLALIPLLRSNFFGPMAAALMGGITVATILTLVYLPALYALWFRVRRDEPSPVAAS